MRRTLPVAIPLTILIFLGLVGTEIWITYRGPFHPGSPFFQLQIFGEQACERLILDKTDRAEYALSILMRRTIDLSFVRGTKHEELALEYVDGAIDQASSAVAAAPQESASLLRPELFQLIKTVEAAVTDMLTAGQSNTSIMSTLIAKVSILKNLLGEKDLTLRNLSLELGVLQTFGRATPSPPAAGLPTRTPLVTIQPHAVMFPPGSPGALHEFYPLIGEHASLDCLSCHADGRFSGTSYTCEACHQEVHPAGHFPGNCSLCHSPTSWGEIHFDHALAGATDCIACHSIQKPANHYPGQCSACHTTSAWRPATFNHQAAGATDCIACHINRKPAYHYDGQCSACHSTSTWSGATFNHQAVGATDCLACHSARKPANHYDGQCSACHSTSTWSGAVFNHQAAGATDCLACHNTRRPANHYDGQCSACHSTSTWSGATFNHSFPTNHGNANGECSACHPSGGSAWTCYNCHEQAKMEEKHTEKDIFDIATRCIGCHPSGEGD